MIDKKLLKLIGKDKVYILHIETLLIISLVSNVVVTMLICHIISMISKGKVNNSICFMVIGIIICILLRYIVSKKAGYLKDELGRSVKKNLREQVYNKIIELGTNSTDEMNMAGLTQMAIEGIEQLDLYYSSYIPQFFYAMIAPVILFLISVFIDWKVALVLICAVPLIPISIIGVSKYAKRIFAKYWKKYTSMGDGFLDSVQGLKELKIFKADSYQHQAMNEQSEEFRKITMKVLVMQLASTTIMDLIAYGGAGIGIVVCLNSIINGSLQWDSGLFLMLISVDFFLPLRAFGSSFHVAMNGASAGGKIIDLLNKQNPMWGEKEITNLSLELDHFTFSYDGEKNILSDVTIKFPDKGLVAIVGESGSGKTSIVKALSGQINLDSDCVKINNLPLHDYSRKSLFNNIGIVSFNTYIFHDTIINNFKLANPNVTISEIYEALKEVNLYDFVIENGGLDKVIEEDSVNISGGQSQRLALAINLVSNKAIYIFDEATSNIDSESEMIIMNTLKKLSLDKLVIMITHRLSNTINSQVIYYMENGMVKESGTYQELIEKKSAYYNLYSSQEKLENEFKEQIYEK